MVGRCVGGMFAHSGCDISERFVLASQGLDGAGSCFGMGQYTDYSWAGFLRPRNSYRAHQALVRKRSNGTTTPSGRENLSDQSTTAAAVSPHQAILESSQQKTNLSCRRRAIHFVEVFPCTNFYWSSGLS